MFNQVKTEPSDSISTNSNNNSNEALQQEILSTNGKSTLKTSKLNEITRAPIAGASSKQAELTASSSMDPTDIEKTILEICKQNPDGITDQVLQNGMPTISSQQRIAALNRLLSLNKIDLVKSSHSGLLYRLKDLDAVMKGSDVDEKLIYSIIKESGNKGIWIRDITLKTNIKTTVLNKTLKSLESKKLIKSVTSVAASKKKVYMLFELEPDRSLTGGSWYNGKEFESEFVEILNEQCYLYLLNKKAKASEKFKSNNIKNTFQISDPLAIRNASYGTAKEITDYIKNLGISRVELNVEDIETILNTLVFDGKVERTVIHSESASISTKSNSEHTSLYRAVNSILPSRINDDENEESVEEPMDIETNQNIASFSIEKRNIKKVKGYGSGLVRVPCGICPVIDDCHENGPISPKTCIYMKDWLEF